MHCLVIGLVVSAQLYIGKTHITVAEIRISIKHTLFFDNFLIVSFTLYFAYQHTSCSNYHHMYVTVLVWVKIQFDRKEIPSKYKFFGSLTQI
jgi:hypothetical protein